MMGAPDVQVQAVVPRNVVLHGECLAVLKTLPENSLDACVTDPPAGIAFMGKDWDAFRRRHNPHDAGRDNVFGRTSAHGPHSYGESDRGYFIETMTAIFAETLRVVKPGGHALVWALPRTSHWTAMALEDAGWEIRDCITHHFGSGFPKSLDVAKSIEALLTRGSATKNDFGDLDGARRPGRVGLDKWAERGGFRNEGYCEQRGAFDLAPTTAEAATWQGWGSALKPGTEFWWLCRKPLSEANIAANVLRWGTGALNIAATRIGTDQTITRVKDLSEAHGNQFGKPGIAYPAQGYKTNPPGRWPANLVLSHSVFCRPIGERKVRNPSGSVRGDEPSKPTKNTYGEMQRTPWSAYGDAEGMETVTAWACHESCPVRMLDAQSGGGGGGGGRPPPTPGHEFLWQDGGE